MRPVLERALREVLDATGALGVGLVDATGLLVHACGEHAGVEPEAFAAALVGAASDAAHGLFDDALEEAVLIGSRVTVAQRRCEGGRLLLYLVLDRRTPAGPARWHAAQAAAAIEKLVNDRALLGAARERLEQLRQFGDRFGTGRVRQHVAKLLER
jgi:predicted regulator of Ras-like GTPase activity (Roadblock/LC7/MglB family)